MNDATLASVAPGLSSLGMGIETSPRSGNPPLLIIIALWRWAIALVHRVRQREALT
jgi:hypothetical protein